MKYAYLLIPAVLFFLLPVVHAMANAHKAEKRRKAQIAEKERREAARREALRKANEEREAQKAAEKAAEEAAKAAMPKRGPGRPRKNPEATAANAATPKRKPGRPRKEPAPEQRPENISPAAPAADPVPAAAPAATDPDPAVPVTPKRPVVYIGNNIFAGETVSFTGTLPGMTRREAIEAVKKNGGKAYDNMPAGTTILVVGDRPGKRKLDAADRWIGSCRKITAINPADPHPRRVRRLCPRTL